SRTAAARRRSGKPRSSLQIGPLARWNASWYELLDRRASKQEIGGIVAELAHDFLQAGQGAAQLVQCRPQLPQAVDSGVQARAILVDQQVKALARAFERSHGALHALQGGRAL